MKKLNFIDDEHPMYNKECVAILKKYLAKPSTGLEDLNEAWVEPHRHYHTLSHLSNILMLIDDLLEAKEIKTVDDRDILVMAAFFHDYVYDPKSNTNEEDSAAEFLKVVKGKKHSLQIKKNIKIIHQIILDTKTHDKPSCELSSLFIDLDLYRLCYGTLREQIEDERKIFREYGFVDWKIYHAERLKILKKINDHFFNSNTETRIEYLFLICEQKYVKFSLNAYIEWFEQHQPKIAVFSGSFFPFHIGHLDILKKAEKIFDKVIIACGINKSKASDEAYMTDRYVYINELKQALPNNQIELFEGMLHDYVKEKQYPLTLVKGLRDSKDLDFEKMQLRFIEDFSDVNVTFIVCDREYEHVSSSAIKQIKEFRPELTRKYLNLK